MRRWLFVPRKPHHEISAHPDVPISVLLTFNKLKMLTSDVWSLLALAALSAPQVAEVAEAVQDSQVVALSADKLSIKRTLAAPEPKENADECSVYVVRHGVCTSLKR
jgi:hypothetical protein